MVGLLDGCTCLLLELPTHPSRPSHTSVTSFRPFLLSALWALSRTAWLPLRPTLWTEPVRMLLLLLKLMLLGLRGAGGRGAVPVPMGTRAILLTARWSQEPLEDAIRDTSVRPA
jgi:hypothetical protein